MPWPPYARERRQRGAEASAKGRARAAEFTWARSTDTLMSNFARLL